MAQPGQPAVSRTLINQVADWLIERALRETDLESVILGCCERLHAAGLPVVRGFFGFSVLHPLYSATGITWQRGDGTKIADYPHTPGGQNPSYRRSPFYHMEQRGLELMRVCLDCTDRQYDFPILKELQEQGITDYIAFRVAFDDTGTRGMTSSWSTDHGAGFREEDIDALVRINRRLAVAAKVALRGKLMQNVAWTYLGREAGTHVLSGQIKRGDGQSIKAAIWFADIRASTVLADTVSSQEYIDTLNGFFEATGRAIEEEGGQILSFIGDGLLAIFPTDSSANSVGDACGRAHRAALDAEERIAAWNEARKKEGRHEIGYGISLHLGEVMFGNVGAAERLSFSAFGSAVNEVTRLDQLTKKLSEPLIASEAFVASIDADWRLLGPQNLRGIDRPMVVYAPERSTAPVVVRPQPPARPKRTARAKESASS